jgi:hypothetical protein
MIYSKEKNFLLLKNYAVNADYIESVLAHVVPLNSIITKVNFPNCEFTAKNCEGFKEHMPIVEISKKIDLKDIKTYIVVRNPYHTVFVDFFNKFVLKGINWENLSDEEKDQELNDYFYSSQFLKSTKELYLYDNMLFINDVIIYEDGVEEQINEILESHQIPKVRLVLEDVNIPKFKNFLDVFSVEHINKITDEWKWEFDNFGYERFTE